MEVQPSIPAVLDPDQFDSLIPEGLFYRTESSQEYQFMLRFITRVLSLIDHSDTALLRARKSPIESRFLQPNQEIQSVSSRIQSDAKFIADLTMRCCFSLTTVIGALDYLLRLHAKGIVQLHSISWKTLFVTCCLLGEKVWEDNYVHPSHIISQYGYLAKGGSNIPKREYLELQMLLVGALNWETNTPSQRYRELITNIMGVAVPYSIYKTLPAGYAGFVPRPLPPIPKMNLPISRPRAATADSHTFTRFSSAASTSVDSIHAFEDHRPVKLSRFPAGGSSTTSSTHTPL
jgi:hypothetical protein